MAASSGGWLESSGELLRTATAPASPLKTLLGAGWGRAGVRTAPDTGALQRSGWDPPLRVASWAWPRSGSLAGPVLWGPAVGLASSETMSSTPSRGLGGTVGR